MVEIHHAWKALCKEAKLSGWRIHDLRHAFASTAANSGHSLPMIGAVLGHAQPSTTARYAHIAQNPAHQLTEDTAERLRATLDSRTLSKN